MRQKNVQPVELVIRSGADCPILVECPMLAQEKYKKLIHGQVVVKV